VILILFGLTFWAIQVSGSVTKTPVKKALSSFPQQIGNWKCVKQEYFSAPVVDMLGVDDYISYAYASKDGQRVNLYVSYFGSVGVTGGYHSPQNCLPGGGWNIVSVESVELKSKQDSGEGGRIRKIIIQKGSERQVVLYWFYNRGRIISSEYWEKIYLVLDAVFKGRRDGSFIRIMAYTKKDDTGGSIDSIINFADDVSVILDEFVPGK
jgi:EpsI family protein